LSDRGKGWLIAAVAAAALVVGFAASSLAYRYRLLRVPHEPVIVRMQRELNLTFSQREQILEIIQDTRFKIVTLRQQFEHQRRDQLRQAYNQIRALLNPEQQQKFDREFKPPSERFRPGPPGMHP
jgi:Spy/CpxP family protein refolding chaperone